MVCVPVMGLFVLLYFILVVKKEVLLVPLPWSFDLWVCVEYIKITIPFRIGSHTRDRRNVNPRRSQALRPETRETLQPPQNNCPRRLIS